MNMIDPDVENKTDEMNEVEEVILEENENLEVASVSSDELGEVIESDEFVSDELDGFESEAVEDLECLDDTQIISILESVLFATDKPQGLGTFKQVFKGTDVDTARIKKHLENLKIDYAGGHRGITLEETTGGYQLRTKSDNMAFIKRMIKGRSFKLSGPALEVLSIVAYKQPSIKSHIDEIRGVESGHILRGLMDRGMVNFAGKSELPGKPMMYGTSRKFLEIFGLRNLNELPSLSEIDELLPDGIEEENEKNETLDQLSTQLSKEAITTYSESEEELGKITDQLSDISSSTDFFEQEKIRQKEERDTMRAQDLEDALTVGEEVSNKDAKWLEKYKLALEADKLALEGESTDESSDSEEEVLATTEDEVVVGDIVDSIDFELKEDFIEESVEVSADSSVEKLESEGDIVAEIESIEVLAESEPTSGESVETSEESTVEDSAKKIGQVDIASLKDDLDFLG